MKKGKLFVISGPSAVGKGTIVREILNRRKDDLFLSVSATTRAPREGEEDGVHYYFLSKEEFEGLIEKDGFIEHAIVHENRYGTPKAPVREHLDNGEDVILEIDVQGGMMVRESMNDTVLVFILPPSLEALRERIMERGTESAEQVEIRLGKAFDEIKYLDRYDYAVVNDDLETAVSDVMSVMTAERARVGEEAADVIEMYRREEK